MSDVLRVVVEPGPKGKKVAAYSPDWPGLSRGDKTEEAVLVRLESYIPRYAPIAALAGLEDEFGQPSSLEVVDHVTGTGSTDFWGISFAKSDFDWQPVSKEELERELSLLQASWVFFDDVRGRVSAEMQKGPRGGGRDRDKIVRHTLGAELDFSKGVGVRTPVEEMLTEDGLARHRTAYVEALRAHHGEGKTAGKSPLRFVIRHSAYHVLDHAWEMEDKDLTGKTM